MSKDKGKENKPNFIQTTRIGSVSGQVHTGSGDLIVKSFSISDSINNKDEFMIAMQQLKNELQEARQIGLNDDTTDDILSEIEAAEREATKENPKSERILHRLKQAQEILTASANVAAVATTAVNTVNKLLPLFENAIQTAGRIFIR